MHSLRLRLQLPPSPRLRRTRRRTQSRLRYNYAGRSHVFLFLGLAIMPAIAMNEESAQAQPEPAAAQQLGHKRHTYEFEAIDDATDEADEKTREEKRIFTKSYIALYNAYSRYGAKYQEHSATPEDLNSLHMNIQEATSSTDVINKRMMFGHTKDCCSLRGTSDAALPLLGHALLMGDLAAAKLLVTCKADVHATVNEWGTPLLHAITILAMQSDDPSCHCEENTKTCNYTNAVRFLLEHKADIEKRNPFGQTPLLSAAYNTCPSVIRLLLDNKSDVNARDDIDVTALQCAAIEQNEPAIRLLLEHGAATEKLTLGKEIPFNMDPMEPAEQDRLYMQHQIQAETRKKLPAAHEYLATVQALIADEKLCSVLLSHENSPLLPLLKPALSQIVAEYTTSPEITKKIKSQKEAKSVMTILTLLWELL